MTSIEMTLLLVDDSQLILKMGKDLIKNGFGDRVHVLLAASGEEAIQVIENNYVDVMILDVVMPGINGVDVLKFMADSNRLDKTKILMCTSLTDKRFIKECFDLGASDYILKPLDSNEFAARISSAISEQQLKRELQQSIQIMREQNEELQSLYQELIETQSKLLQKEQMSSIGQLAAGIAHEINNPLGYVTSNVATLKNYLRSIKNFIGEIAPRLKENEEVGDVHQLKEKLKRLWDQQDIEFVLSDVDDIYTDIHDGLGKISFIVNSLRSFSKIDHMGDREYYDINEAIEQIILLTMGNESNDIRIETVFDAKSSVLVMGKEINQALLNILKNAIDAIKLSKKGGHIYISTYENSNEVVCSIADDGPGISEAYLSSIFTPFFTTKEVGSGIGLGLSVSYDIIVNKHHGKLEVASEIDKGTKFIVSLPKNTLEE